MLQQDPCQAIGLEMFIKVLNCLQSDNLGYFLLNWKQIMCLHKIEKYLT